MVSAQKPTAITHAVTGNFTGPDDLNLIVAKTTRIEIHLLTSDGLKPLLDVNIYGRIATMSLFRASKQKQDFLFISTERYDIMVIRYNSSTGEIITEASGNVSERVGRPVDSGQITMVDPDSRLIFLHIYTGHLKCIPIDENSNLKEAFNIRIEELQILDITYLSGCLKPTIAILYQDVKGNKHIKSYEILIRDKNFAQGPWLPLLNVEDGASKLIPVPKPCGGVIVVCEQTLTYTTGANEAKSIATHPTSFVAYGQIDKDGSRFLLGDHLGILYILFLKHSNSKVTDVKLEKVGETSIPKALCYLDNGVVFVGSAFGDSQLIQLRSESDEKGNFIEILDSFTNLGPIVDFCVVDLDRQGQGQIVTCSGVGKDGSLRVIRNGVGINEMAMLELNGMNGVWALRNSFDASFDSMVVVSFIRETRFLSIQGEELEEKEVEGFSSQEQTIFCSNVINKQFVQITESSIRLVDCGTLKLNSSYSPPKGKKINVGSCNSQQVLISTGSGHLMYFEIANNQLMLKQETDLEYEISCVNLNVLNNESGSNGQSKASICAVGLWTDVSVRILGLPNLNQLHKQLLGGEILPRSVLLVTFEEINYLLCGLGDGQIFHFTIDIETGMLQNLKKITLGTQPIILNTFKSNHSINVFASSDRPTVIYSSNKKLLFSNVNLKEVSNMTPLNSQAFPDSLAIASKEGLTIGTIDEIQKLHIRTIPLCESPRRISYHEKSNVFGVLTATTSPTTGDDINYFKIIDEQTFETLHSYQLETFEQGSSIEVVSFTDELSKYFVVGTAYAMPTEEEPTKGRILVFSVSDNTNKNIKLITEKSVKGAVYALESFNGKLLATINSKVHLFKMKEGAAKELVSECGHHGHVVALYLKSRGDFIIVGDLIKSISLLIYKQIDGTIEEIARDYNPSYLSSIDILDDDTFIGSDNSFNLFTVKKNSETASDEERRKLEVIGQYHLGEFINRFRRGSLVMKLNETYDTNASNNNSSSSSNNNNNSSSNNTGNSAAPGSSIDTLLYATTSGSIGVIATIPQQRFQFLQKVQTNLTKVIKGVGGLKHESWRTFITERKVSESRNFIDGDLIESFLDLKREKMQEVIEGKQGGTPLNMSVDDLIKIIDELTRLH